jgi:hypothetical protein
LNLHEGDKVLFVIRDEEVLLLPAPRSLLELRGSVPVTGPQDFDAIREQVHQALAQSR